MLNPDAPEAAKVIRRYLDEMAFEYVTYKMAGSRDWDVFPQMALLRSLHTNLKGILPVHHLLFGLFRLGFPVEDGILRRLVHQEFLEAAETVGLLERNKAGQWSTPGIAVVPVGGLYLAASLPSHYATARTTRQPVYLGRDSVMLTRATPRQLRGHTVLDVCAGSGIQGLTCALRGASHVVCLELDETAVEFSRFNATLNGFAEIVEVRHSNLFSALHLHERFSFVISNPPFMPVSEDLDYPMCGAGGPDGTRITRQILEGLQKFLSESAEGVMYCNALGALNGLSLSDSILESQNVRSDFGARIYKVGATPFSDYVKNVVEPNIDRACPTISAEAKRASLDRWQDELRKMHVPMDYLYDEILYFGVGQTAKWFDFSKANTSSRANFCNP